MTLAHDLATTASHISHADALFLALAGLATITGMRVAINRHRSRAK